MRAWAWVVGALLSLSCAESGGPDPGVGFGGSVGAGGFGGQGGQGAMGGAGVGNVSLNPGPCGALAFGHIPGETVHCSVLDVPGSWEQPDDGERFKLPVTRYVPSGGGEGLPIILLLGGPGDESDDYSDDLTPEMIDTIGHELIVFDQRGTGRAQPSPECTELASVDPADPASGLDELAACRDRLTSEGVRLERFNTFFSARDVGTLVQLLGYDKVALLGLSYGTRLALATLRAFPERIGAVVLDSVTPPHLLGLEELAPGIDDALDRLVAACAADATCNAAHPALDGKIDQIFAGLPISWNGVPGGQLTEEMLAAAIVAILGRDVYAIDDLPPFVDLVQASVTAGSVSAQLGSALSQSLASTGGYDVAMFYSVTCADNQLATEERAAERRAGVRPGLVPYFELTSYLGFSMCQGWPIQPAAQSAFEPVVSDVPALVLTARFDGITPPSWAEAAASHLSQSTVVGITRAAHLVLFTDPSQCAFQLTKQFLDAPGPITPSCAK